MSTLSKEDLLKRLNKDEDNSIIVTPILDYEKQINQIGIDCRLGNQFVIFRSQNIESIDILNFANNKINLNNIQEEVVVPFKNYFILHPQNSIHSKRKGN